MDWLQQSKDGEASFLLHIQPGAKRTEIVGLHGDALKIRLNAPPVDGKANTALIAFFAEQLGVPRGAVSLEAGAASRRKRISVSGAASAALAALKARIEADPH